MRARLKGHPAGYAHVGDRWAAPPEGLARCKSCRHKAERAREEEIVMREGMEE